MLKLFFHIFILCFNCSSIIIAQDANFDSLFKVDDKGWLKKEVPEGYNYLCIKCKQEVRIEIAFGPRLNNIDRNEYKILEEKFTDSNVSKQIAEQIIKNQVPISILKIVINKVSFSEYFSLRMLQYQALIGFENSFIPQTGFIGPLDDRVVRLTISYLYPF